MISFLRSSLKLAPQKNPPQGASPLALRALEPRILLDAAGAATAAEGLADEAASQQADAALDLSGAPSNSPAAVPDIDLLAEAGAPPHGAREIVFIDAGVADPAALLEGVSPHADVHFLNADEDGVTQIADILAQYEDIGAVHILAHGDQGRLILGDAVLDLASMTGEHADELSAIGAAIGIDGDILIYGCDFAGGEAGLEAAMLLSRLTGADVAASTDDTGHADLGGDWDLEAEIGAIETLGIAVSGWSGLLAPTNIIVNGDFSSGTAGWTVTGDGGVGSGIFIWGTDGGAGTLTYDAPLTGLQTGPAASGAAQIQLDVAWNNGQPDLTGTHTLDIQIGGVTYARLTTGGQNGSTATIDYLNGAAGSPSTAAVSPAFVSSPGTIYTSVTIDLPSTVADTGTLQFVSSAGGSRDDIGIDNVQVIVESNTPPTAADDAYTVRPGQALTIDPVGDNDADPDPDTLTITQIIDPADVANPITPVAGAPITLTSGTQVTLRADGGLDVVTPAGLSPSDAFDYVVEDGASGSAQATVTLNVDTDGDAVIDAADIDDDNDGILDTEEGFVESGDITTATSDGGLDISGEASAPTGATFSADGTKFYVISAFNDDAVFQYALATPFDITSGVTFETSFGIADDNPTSVTFSADGLRMFILGADSDQIVQYRLDTNFDLSGTVTNEGALVIAGDTSAPTGIHFSPDGTKLYISESQGPIHEILEYDAAAPFNILPATGGGISLVNRLDVHATQNTPHGVSLSPDGARLYIAGLSDDTIDIFDLATPFDISTASATPSATIDPGFINPFDVWVRPDETGFYAVDASGLEIVQFTVKSGARDTDGDGVFDHLDIDSDNDGITDNVEAQATNAYVAPSGNDADGDGLDAVYEGAGDEGLTAVDTDSDGTADYLDEDSDNDGRLDIAERGDSGPTANPTFEDADFDGLDDDFEGADANDGYDVNDENVSTASGDAIGTLAEYNLSASPLLASDFSNYSAGATDLSFRSADIDGDGVRDDIDIDDDNDGIRDTDEVIAAITEAELDGSLDVSGDADFPQDLAFSSDGSRLYVLNLTTDTIFQYELTTPFDIDGGATLQGSFVVTSQEPTPNGLTLSDDGTKLFISGNTGRVNQYSLTTAFDVTSGVSHDGDFSLPAGENRPNGLEFSEDGLSVFVIGEDNEVVHQYNLSAPFDITAGVTLVHTLNISAQDLEAEGIAFSNGGRLMHIVGRGAGAVHTYELSTPFNLTTAAFRSTRSVIADATSPRGVAFTPEGESFFVVDGATGVVFEYNTDTDRDGVANYLDIDSDNDGITDNVEAQATNAYVAPSGNDADGDGLDDVYDADDTDIDPAASAGLTPVNTDSDATADYLDTDSDNDGRLDIAERGDGGPTANPTFEDADGDGLDDDFEGADANDGYDVNDENVATAPGATVANLSEYALSADPSLTDDFSNIAARSIDLSFRDADADNDGVADADDIDDDNDGVRDTDEGGDYGFSDEGARAVWWPTNGGNGASAVVINSDVVASAEDFVAGPGMTATTGTGDTALTGVDQPDFAGALADGDYLQYEFTTVFGGDFLGVDMRGGGQNVGRDITVVISNDGFATSEILLQDANHINDAVNLGSNAQGHEFDQPYALDPNTTYSVRIYHYNSTIGTDIRVDNVSFRINPFVDTDADGVADRLDLDSDNDGIADNVEAQATNAYVAPSGNDADGDGLDDVYDADDADIDPAASAGLTAIDTDGDAIADYLDTDSDNDGRLDIAERGDGGPTANPTFEDADGDGLDDDFEGADANDGFDPNDENIATAPGATVANLSEYALSADPSLADDFSNIAARSIDLSFRDADADNDGVADADDIDDDNDGIQDVLERGATVLSTPEDASSSDPELANLQSTRDGTTAGPSFAIDNANDDGPISDVTYTYATPLDGVTSVVIWNNGGDVFTDGQSIGVIGQLTLRNSLGDVVFTTTNVAIPEGSAGDPFTLDLPGTYDNVASMEWLSIDGPAGGLEGVAWREVALASLPARDSDNDGVFDHLDLDSDNDGITDNVEAQATNAYIAPSGNDADGDGLDDVYDADDGDVDAAASVGLAPVDSDVDGMADYLDTDSDNDGRLDIAERGDGGPMANPAFEDADGDGLDDDFEGADANDGYDVNDENVATAAGATVANLVEYALGADPALAASLSNYDPLSDGAPTIDLLFRDDNVAPVDGDEAVATAEDTALNVIDGSAGDLLANATDADGDAPFILDFTVGGATYAAGATATLAEGTLTINANGSYTFIPAANFNGAVPPVAYTVSDGNGGTDASTLTIAVTAAGDPPAINLSGSADVENLTNFAPTTLVFTTPTIINAGQTEADDGVGNGETLIYANAGVIGGTPIDIVATIISNTTNTAFQADVSSGALAYSVRWDGDVTVRFDVVEAGSMTQIQGDFAFQSSDLDGARRVESLIFDTDDLAFYRLNADTSITVSEADGRTTFRGGTNGPATNPGTSLEFGLDDVSGFTLTFRQDTSLTTPGGRTIFLDGDFTSILTTPVMALGNVDYATSFTEGDAPVAVADSDADAFDADDDIVSLAIVAGGIADGAAEQLTLAGAIFDLSVDGAASGVAIGGGTLDISYVAATGAFAVTNAMGASIPMPDAALDALIRSIAYENASEDPTPGDRAFVFTATDAEGASSNPATTIVSVTPVNDAPVDGDETASTAEDTPLTVADGAPGDLLANASDVDGGPLAIVDFSVGGTTYAAGVTATLPEGDLTVNANGSFTFIPATDFAGTVPQVSYVVSDGAGGLDVSTLAISVTSSNDGPIATDNAYATEEDVSVAGNAILDAPADSDADTSVLSLAAGSIGTFATAEGGAIALNPDGAFVYAPPANFIGTDTFDYTVTDGALTDVGRLTFTVSPVNDAPVAVANVYETTEDTEVLGNLIGDDTGAGADFDVDLDALQINAGSIGAFVTTAGGAIFITPDGAFAYAPPPDFNGTDTFDYVITDGALTASATVTFLVNAVNDGPVATDNAYQTDEDVAVSGDAILDLPADRDIDTPSLSLAADSIGTFATSEGGRITLAADGSFTYAPPADFVGTDTFDYTVTDGALTDVGKLAFTVGAVNDPPVAIANLYATLEDSGVAGNLITDDTGAGVDFDVDLDALRIPPESVGTFATPAGGAITIAPDGAFTYTPLANFHGEDTFVYVITDGDLSASAAVSFQISPLRDAPTDGDEAIAIAEDTPARVNAGTDSGLLANAADADGDALFIVDFSVGGGTYAADETAFLPQGALTIRADGSYEFVPAPDFNGPIPQIAYTVSDGFGGADTSTLDITVTPANDAPRAAAGGALGDRANAVDDPVSAQTSDAFTDVDGDDLTFSADGLPPGLAIDAATGVISGAIAPEAALIAAYEVTVTARDETGASVSLTFVWRITDAAAADIETIIRLGGGPGGDETNATDADSPYIELPETLWAQARAAAGIDADGAVIAAANAASHLEGLTAIDAEPSVLAAVNGADPLGGLSPEPISDARAHALIADAQARFGGGDASIDLLQVRGFSLAGSGSGAFAIDSVSRGGVVYLRAYDAYSSSQKSAYTDFNVTLGDGRATPRWISTSPDGLVVIDRPANVETVVLKIVGIRNGGGTDARLVEIDTLTGEILRREAANRAYGPSFSEAVERAASAGAAHEESVNKLLDIER